MNVMFSRFTPLPGPFLHLSADLPLLLLPACLSPDLLSAPTSFVALLPPPELEGFNGQKFPKSLLDVTPTTLISLPPFTSLFEFHLNS